VLARFTPGEIAHRSKQGGSPVTEADTAVNEKLLAILPRGDEGWLSEETADDAGRLDSLRVWVVRNGASRSGWSNMGALSPAGSVSPRET